ncbi:SCO2102 family sporulation regulator [Streptomyces sp. NPDC054842]
MGWTVLYIAFGMVALWLLGEVLLQYKARLRWRLLAFGGFLCVVLGVLIPSVVVIGLGAAAFAVGQTYVTLSFRRGFSTGWAIGGRPGASKRRRGEPDREDLAPEDSGQEPAARPSYAPDDDYDPDDVFTPAQPASAAPAAEATAVYEPQPLPDDTGSYGVYDENAYAAQQSYGSADQSQNQQAYAYDGYTGYDQQQYGYDTGQQQYAAYSDPYIGTQTYGSASYDTTYGGQQQYGQQGYDQSQYGGGQPGETPPGGVWVPQQRNADDPYGGELPPEQPYPYQGDGNGHGNTGYDEQYRY